MSDGRRECTHPRAQHHHGTRGAYEQDRCRCMPCCYAKSKAKRVYRQSGSYCELREPAHGMQRRLRALYALGWTWDALGARLGTTGEAVLDLCRPRKFCMATTAAKVRALYDQLSMSVPSGAAADRARTLAARKGWLPPLALDDDTIDDPSYQPGAGEPVTPVLDEVLVERYMTGQASHGTYRPPPERLEAIRRLAERGMSDAEIGRRVRMSRDAVCQERQRHGIPPGQPSGRVA